jgi:ABC-type transport system involved in multi-copper enzyme maturation permease subunit
MTISDLHGITSVSSDARVSSAGTVAAEWVKFRTLRSTLAVLGAAMVGMVLIGIIVAFNTRHLSANLQPDDIVPSSTLQGYYLAQLLIGALGVLFVSGEYGTGMIRSTLAAVPTRVPVLLAKAVVVLVVSAVTMTAVSVLAFLAAQALLGHYRTGYSLGDPGALRVVIGTGIYLTLVGLLGSAIGWIVRSTPGALVTYLAVILVLPLLLGNVLGTAGRHVAEFLPTTAGAAFSTSLPEGLSLHPWPGLGLMAAWVVATFVVAVVVLRRRDA